jgi:hypothetical protein
LNDFENGHKFQGVVRVVSRGIKDVTLQATQKLVFFSTIRYTIQYSPSLISLAPSTP